VPGEDRGIEIEELAGQAPIGQEPRDEAAEAPAQRVRRAEGAEAPGGLAPEAVREEGREQRVGREGRPLEKPQRHQLRERPGEGVERAEEGEQSVARDEDSWA